MGLGGWLVPGARAPPAALATQPVRAGAPGPSSHGRETDARRERRRYSPVHCGREGEAEPRGFPSVPWRAPGREVGKQRLLFLSLQLSQGSPGAGHQVQDILRSEALLVTVTVNGCK